MLKDHNAVAPVRLEPGAPQSRVKHSITEPLRSLNVTGDCGGTCRYRCSQKISNAERKEMFDEFWLF